MQRKVHLMLILKKKCEESRSSLIRTLQVWLGDWKGDSFSLMECGKNFGKETVIYCFVIF